MINDEVDLAIDEMKEGFNKAIDFLKSEYNSIKAGRANPAVLDKIVVDYYGTPTSIKQMANISTLDARTLTVSVWDISALKEVSKAIMAANIGLTPSDDGKVIRLTFPILTEERRRELVKTVRANGENAKIALRNERRNCLDFCKKLKNDKVISEDDLTGIDKEVQKMIDSYNQTVDKIVADKEKEVLTV